MPLYSLEESTQRVYGVRLYFVSARTKRHHHHHHHSLSYPAQTNSPSLHRLSCNFDYSRIVLLINSLLISLTLSHSLRLSCNFDYSRIPLLIKSLSLSLSLSLFASVVILIIINRVVFMLMPHVHDMRPVSREQPQ